MRDAERRAAFDLARLRSAERWRRLWFGESSYRFELQFELEFKLQFELQLLKFELRHQQRRWRILERLGAPGLLNDVSRIRREQAGYCRPVFWAGRLIAGLFRF
jgi:hypothetical protein